jgi:hypothetical protein
MTFLAKYDIEMMNTNMSKTGAIGNNYTYDSLADVAAKNSWATNGQQL